MKKLYYIYALVLLICFQTFSLGSTDSVQYKQSNLKGHVVDVVSADLSDPRVYITPVVATDFPNRPESFQSMIARTRPAAAINGNFFCKNTYKPIGDIVIDGDLVYFGGMGTAMAVTKDNKVKFIKVDKWHHMNWDNYQAVISCGPLLLSDGVIVVNARSEGFKDPNLFVPRNRSAVGLTYDNRVLFVTTNDAIYFEELARIMKDLGCKDAMNLDGGGSSGLYYRGDMISSPRTPLPDILIVQEREFAPNFLLSLREKMIKGQTRIEMLSSVAMIINKDQFMVKGIKDGKVILIMKFENPDIIEAPQWGAKISASQNKLTIKFPLERIEALFYR
jgi:uncharacterized protein YigE (DUF2233 family)